MKFFFMLIILSGTLFANENVSLKNVQELKKRLPDYQWIDLMEEGESEYTSPRYYPPKKFTSYDEIKNSPIRQMIIKKRAQLVRMHDDKVFYLTKNALVNAHILIDEGDYLYLIDEKNQFFFKVSLNSALPVGDIVKIYEPPKLYKEFKKDTFTQIDNFSPRFYPELIVSTGVTQSVFTEDLLEDNRAKTTFYTRYGVAGFVDFQKKVKTGLTVQYERSLHYLKDHNRALFSSLSIGPIVRSPTFNQDDWPWQISAQMRWAPNSTLTTDTSSSTRFVMNVTALQLAFEHPIKNDWGEMILGFGFQRQWINLRRQDSYVRLDSDNNQNDQYGFTLSQSFY